MWCKACTRETQSEHCEICGAKTEEDIPIEIYWCEDCKTPIIKEINAIDKISCPLCGKATRYLAADLRPVFPEERLLIEILVAKPFAYMNKSVWASNSRYYIDGKVKNVPISKFANANIQEIIKNLEKYKNGNTNDFFLVYIERFIEANLIRLNYLTSEAFNFIQNAASKYPPENIVISFSGVLFS